MDAVVASRPPPQVPPAPEDTPPPHSAEAEQSVLGSLLQDNGAIALVGDLIEPECFYVHDNRVIFGVVVDLLKRQQPADVVTVYERLSAMGVAQECGGLPYLGKLLECVASARNVRRHAEIVVERWAERMLIAGADDISRVSRLAGMSLAERMDRIASVLARVEAQRKGPGTRVPLLRLAALRETAQAVKWTVKHVIPSASIGMLFGGSGTFKSFIALDCALHVAHGLPWMGRLTKQAPVLYIAAEGGAGLWSRIEAWHRQRNLRWDDAPLYVVPTAVDLSVDAWRVVDAAQAIGATPGLVIVDTLSQTYSGEENSANEMAAYLREIGLRFRALWLCAVLLVHHTGHSATERPRGSSAIRANLDYLLGVQRDEKEMLATLSCQKQKDGDLFSDSTFQMSKCDLGRDEDGDMITSLVARHLSTQDEVSQAQADEQRAGRGGRNQRLLAMVQNGMPEKELRKVFNEELRGTGLTDPEALKKAYFRARKTAIDSLQIEVAEGFIIDLRGGK